MKITPGEANRRQIILLSVLGVFIVGFGGWQIYSSFFSSSTPAQPAVKRTADALPEEQSDAPAKPSAGAAAQKINRTAIDPALHFDKLAQSESVLYAGSGRNIFSGESAPMPIEAPIKSARNTAQAKLQPLPPAVPRPPNIDLKYFGYSQDKDKTLKAFFVHGDDIFMARVGEVIDRRYKVNVIRPMSVEVTDLSYNNTQTLALSQQ
jgi:hypothetical protein